MRRHGRTAATILELISAMILFSAAATVTVQTLSGVAALRRTSERQQFALQEATNVLERLSAVPWTELTSDTAAGTMLSSEAERRLPGTELAVSIDPVNEPIEGRRITVEVRWKNAAGETQAPVRLTTWRYAAETAENSP